MLGNRLVVLALLSLAAGAASARSLDVYWVDVDGAPASERAQADVEAYKKAKVDKRVTPQAGAEIPLAQAPGAAPLHLRFISARQDLVAPAELHSNDAVCKDLAERPVDFTDNA